MKNHTCVSLYNPNVTLKINELIIKVLQLTYRVYKLLQLTG